MILETAKGKREILDIGQFVYYIQDRRIVRKKVQEIQIIDYLGNGEMKIFYRWEGEPRFWNPLDYNIFLSLEDILNALKAPFDKDAPYKRFISDLR